MLATRASSGVGCSRNSRNLSVASSRSPRAAGYACVSRPITRPTTTGSTPERRKATHAASPSARYTTPRRTPAARTARTTAKVASPASSAGSRDVVAVEDSDDRERGQVVHHGEGEQEGPHPVRGPRPDQGEHAERERGVGGHRRAPAVRRRPPGVDDEEDGDRHDHPAEARPASGIASRRRSRSSPRSNSRRASSPTTRKKNVIRPLFTQPCRSWEMPALPRRIDSRCPTRRWYDAGLTFAQTSAAIVAVSSTAALPVSVRRNRRSGVCRCRAHAVSSALAAPGPGGSAAMTEVNHAGDLGHRHGCCLEVSCKFTSTGGTTNSEELVPELSRKRRLLVLAICCSEPLHRRPRQHHREHRAAVDPAHLHAPVSGLQWTVDAYTLVVASFLILAGSTGDRVGAAGARSRSAWPPSPSARCSAAWRPAWAG